MADVVDKEKVVEPARPNAVVALLLSLWKTLWEVWLEPFLTFVHLYEPKDRTYGRSQIPFSKMEARLHANPDVTVSFHKVMMPNNKDFVWYQVWEDKLAMRATGRQADLVYCHGTGVHSGTLASHSRRYLDAGYRLIVPDLPSHGYSTGLHVYQVKMSGYTEGVHAVIHDVARRDDEQSGTKVLKQNRRKTFLLGLSFGGMVACLYPIYYQTSLRSDTTDMDEIPVDGVIAVGAIIDYNPKDVKVGPLVRVVSSIIRSLYATRLELYVPHKKVVDKDPRVYKQLVDQDLRSHRGAFRVGHLFCLRDGIADCQDRAYQFRVPVYVQHGLQDRVVSVRSAYQWLRRVHSDDVKMTVYPACQHVIYRKAKSEEEDKAGRVCVIEDNVQWMNERCPGHGKIERATSFSSDYTVDDMQRSSSFSISSSGLVTPSELALGAAAGGADNVVADTLQTLTDKLGTLGQEGAASTALQASVVDSALTQRVTNTESTVLTAEPGVMTTEPSSVEPSAPAAPTMPKSRHDEPERTYRSNWTLKEEMRPYDLSVTPNA